MNPPLIRIVVLNVGQGDCQLIRFPNGAWGMVDCYSRSSGSAPPAVQFMRDNEIDSLEFICLTHPDYDHFRGMMDVISYISDERGGHIKRFWIFDAPNYGAIAERFKHAMVRLASMIKHTKPVRKGCCDEVATLEEHKYCKGRSEEFQKILFKVSDWIEADELARKREQDGIVAPERRFYYRRLNGPQELPSIGGVRIFCLGPTSEMMHSFEAQAMEWVLRSAFRQVQVEGSPPLSTLETNSVSVVLAIQLGETVLSLGGDAGRTQWNSIFAALEGEDRNPFPIRANFVKASHHGSRFACSQEVLERLTADRAAVAISADCSTNRFGHPHKETLAALRALGKARGVRVYCTNRSESCRREREEPATHRSMRSHGREIFSRRKFTREDGNACFGTCVFDVDAHGSVKLTDSDIRRCCDLMHNREEQSGRFAEGDTPPPEC